MASLMILQMIEDGGRNFINKCLPTIIAVLLLLFITSIGCYADDEIESTGGVFRTTFEQLSLPADEDMGIMGGTFLYEACDWFSVGPGLYGSVTGDRGGFITLGLDGELRKDITDRISFTGGLFVGAGGGRGGYQLSGGGLMLRPHAGFLFRFGEQANIGFGISRVMFPFGDINSTQPYIAAELPFDILIEKGWTEAERFSGTSSFRLPASEQEISLVFQHYLIPRNVRTISGEDQYSSMGLTGVRWQDYIGRHAFLEIGTQGAMQGKSNGYMQILLGGGYRFDLARRTFLKVSAGVGAGGGGGVDTGGGFLLEGRLTAQQFLTDSLFLSIDGGYLDAPDGSFEAATASLEIGYRYGVPNVGKGTYHLAALSDYGHERFRVRAVHQTYLKGNDNWRTHHIDQNVENLGFQVDYFPYKSVYLTGQGLAAYGKGKAGAYMTGLIGAGVHHSFGKTPLFFDLEALGGAAGGGGLAVGGGLVWQVNSGLGIDLTDTFSIIATIGRIEATQGDFEATVAGLSLAYRFSLFADP